MFVKGTPAYQSYDKTGRIFQSLGTLRAFLSGVMNADDWCNKSDRGYRNRVSDWEVVDVKDVKNIHEVISTKKLKELIMK